MAKMKLPIRTVNKRISLIPFLIFFQFPNNEMISPDFSLFEKLIEHTSKNPWSGIFAGLHQLDLWEFFST